MTDITASQELPESGHSVGPDAEQQFEEVWAKPTGLRTLSAVNNSVVASRFIATGFVFFLIGGVLALLMRTQLIVPDNEFLSAERYNQLFTMHGTTMMFIFAVPIMEAFGAYLIPGMIGSRDLAFPRLTSYGYWCYLFGGILVFSSFLVGAVPDGGWFMYVPLTSLEFSPGKNQDFWLIGVTLVEIASITGALELIATILKCRAPGMSLNRMPIFAWYILVVSFMIIFGFPPLVLASILLEAERALGIPFFDPSGGGHPLLWQHLFWIFGHPEVYIIFLPAAGLVSAMLPVFARVRLVAYPLVVLAVIGTGFLSFGLWVHHMYATGIPALALSFFAGASLAVAIPSGIQVFAWIATLWTGRPEMRTPLMFIIGFVIIFVLGGLTGVMVAIVPFDWQVHDTYFVVAHFHYVLIGGMVFPLFAALTYYMPRISGRMMSEAAGKLSFWLMFIGFNVAFLPMHWTGLMGMPRRVYSYPEASGWGTLNLVSSIGAYVVAAGILVFICNVLWHWLWGREAGVNPWRASTLEWANTTPTPDFNIRSIPEVRSADPLWDDPDLIRRIRQADEYLPTALEGRRETLVTSMLEAQPEYVERLSHPTFLPVLAALATAVVFVGVLLQTYGVSAAGAAAFAILLVVWLWDVPPQRDHKDVGKGLRLPIANGDHRSTRWVGAVILVLVDAVIFAALVYSYFYIWTVNDIWPPPGLSPETGVYPIAAVVLLGLVLVPTVLAYRGAVVGSALTAIVGLTFTLVLAAGALAAQIGAYAELPFAAERSAYGGLVIGLGLNNFLHVALTIAAALYALVSVAAHGLRPERSLAVRVAALFASYTVVQGVIVFAIVYLSPAAS